MTFYDKFIFWQVLYIEFGQSRAVLDLNNRPHGPDMFLVQGQRYIL